MWANAQASIRNPSHWPKGSSKEVRDLGTSSEMNSGRSVDKIMKNHPGCVLNNHTANTAKHQKQPWIWDHEHFKIEPHQKIIIQNPKTLKSGTLRTLRTLPRFFSPVSAIFPNPGGLRWKEVQWQLASWKMYLGWAERATPELAISGSRGPWSSVIVLTLSSHYSILDPILWFWMILVMTKTVCCWTWPSRNFASFPIQRGGSFHTKDASVHGPSVADIKKPGPFMQRGSTGGAWVGDGGHHWVLPLWSMESMEF